MLPGLRLVLAAITATFVIVVLGFAQLVKLQVAQSHSASFGPVEARFAGLAFAERADWTPVAPSQARSLEALAPFGNIPLPKPPRPDRVAAHAAAPIQTAALDSSIAEPVQEAPTTDLAPVTVTKVDLAASPEDAAFETDAPNTADSGSTVQDFIQALQEKTTAPGAELAALPSPRSTLTPAVTTQAPVEVHVAALHAPIDPASAALSAANPAAPVPPAGATPPEAPQQVVALPENVGGDETQNTAAPDLELLPVRLPPARPVVAALPSETVPLPTPRPATAPRPVRRVQPRPAKSLAKKKVLPRPAAPAKPAASTAPTNPFAALFGGPSAAGNPPN